MNTVRDTTNPRQQGVGDWEDEGGSLKDEPKAALPDGIIAITTTRYRVGPYLYSTLDDAMAQHRRQSGE